MIATDLKQAKKGDKDALGRLWLAVGQKIAIQTARKCPDHIQEDLAQEGFIAFEKAVHTYDPGRSYSFKSWARWTIFRAQVVATYKQANAIYIPQYRIRKGMKFPTTTSLDGHEPLSLPVEPPEAWEWARKYCSPTEYQFLMQHFQEDLSLAEIGKELNISRQAAWLRLRNVLKTIRKGLENESSAKLGSSTHAGGSPCK